MRARLALYISGTHCKLREVVLRDKPAAMLKASPKGTVPVLVLSDGTVIDESLEVMAWALGRADPEGWLAPAQSDLSAMHDLIVEADGPFKQALDRYKYPNRYENVDPLEQRALGDTFLQKLNTRLTDHSQLFGDRISLADAAIFPFVRQFANTDREWFDAQPIPHLQAWLEGHLESGLFQAIMKKYKQWKPGDEEPLFGTLETTA